MPNSNAIVVLRLPRAAPSPIVAGASPCRGIMRAAALRNPKGARSLGANSQQRESRKLPTVRCAWISLGGRGSVAQSATGPAPRPYSRLLDSLDHEKDARDHTSLGLRHAPELHVII